MLVHKSSPVQHCLSVSCIPSNDWCWVGTRKRQKPALPLKTGCLWFSPTSILRGIKNFDELLALFLLFTIILLMTGPCHSYTRSRFSDLTTYWDNLRSPNRMSWSSDLLCICYHCTCLPVYKEQLHKRQGSFHTHCTKEPQMHVSP